MTQPEEYWHEVIYPILEPFKEELRTIWEKKNNDALTIYHLLGLPPKVIQACRDAGIVVDEVDLLDRFAEMIFEHLCG